ncbi:MAG: hypothetical protein EXQ52_17620 [Bryobacterales bacterium]|nr:hypothetical protein [Bryobacterales bacterium]
MRSRWVLASRARALGWWENNEMGLLRFGLFHFNVATGELLRDGIPVHLQAQPTKVLALLVASHGELVTREALRAAIWSDGTTVDFDRGLNFAIAQVRTALGDSADSPTFVRTIPKRGYQFIAPVSQLQGQQLPARDASSAPQLTVEAQSSRRQLGYWLIAVAAGSAATLTALKFNWSWLPADASHIAVARFENETGIPAFDRLADAVTDSVVEGLTAQTGGRYGVVGNAAILRRSRSFQNLDEISATLRAKYAVLGQLQQDGPRIRLLAHLIQLPAKTHLNVSRVALSETTPASEIAHQIVSDIMKKI